MPDMQICADHPLSEFCSARHCASPPPPPPSAARSCSPDRRATPPSASSPGGFPGEVSGDPEEAPSGFESSRGKSAGSEDPGGGEAVAAPGVGAVGERGGGAGDAVAEPSLLLTSPPAPPPPPVDDEDIDEMLESGVIEDGGRFWARGEVGTAPFGFLFREEPLAPPLELRWMSENDWLPLPLPALPLMLLLLLQLSGWEWNS